MRFGGRTFLRICPMQTSQATYHRPNVKENRDAPAVPKELSMDDSNGDESSVESEPNPLSERGDSISLKRVWARLVARERNKKLSSIFRLVPTLMRDATRSIRSAAAAAESRPTFLSPAIPSKNIAPLNGRADAAVFDSSAANTPRACGPPPPQNFPFLCKRCYWLSLAAVVRPQWHEVSLTPPAVVHTGSAVLRDSEDIVLSLGGHALNQTLI